MATIKRNDQGFQDDDAGASRVRLVDGSGQPVDFDRLFSLLEAILEEQSRIRLGMQLLQSSGNEELTVDDAVASRG
jgi:hypothetical protein